MMPPKYRNRVLHINLEDALNNCVLSYWGRLFWREWTLGYLLVIIIGGVLLTTFLAHTLVIESTPAQISFAAWYIRSVSILSFLLLVPFYFVRLHQSQEIAHLMTQSYSRSFFLWQTWAAFILLACVLCVFSGVLLLLLNSPLVPTALWSLSLLLECGIIISFGLFLSTRLALAIVASLVTFLYYTFGRLSALITASLSSSSPPEDSSIILMFLKIILKLIPAFDQFTQTEWLIDLSTGPNFVVLLSEALLFMALSLILAILTYQKRWL